MPPTYTWFSVFWPQKSQRIRLKPFTLLHTILTSPLPQCSPSLDSCHCTTPDTPGRRPCQAIQQPVANSSVPVSSFTPSETAGLLWKNPENLRVRKLGLQPQLCPLLVVQCWARL